MDIKTTITEGPVTNFAAVRVKIAQSEPTVGADLVGILAAGISEGSLEFCTSTISQVAVSIVLNLPSPGYPVLWLRQYPPGHPIAGS